MKNINLLGCHLLSPFLPSLRLWETDSTRNPAVLWHLCLDISTQTHHGWLLGSDNTLPNETQAEAKISDFLHHLKFRLSKIFSFLKLWTDTLLWTVMDEETWSTHGHRQPGRGYSASCQILKDLHKKNLGDTRNVFTFGYVEVQRLCAVADTAAFALALF